VDVTDKRGLPKGFIDKTEYRDAADYMYKQRKSGTWCDEPMLRGVCTVIGKYVSIILRMVIKVLYTQKEIHPTVVTHHL